MTYLRTLLLLALLAAFPPMSTDMYLPALPALQAAWGVDLATVNLTLVLFFVAFSLALLAYGPISDSYGRRPLLMIGIAVFVTASLLCGMAPGVEYLRHGPDIDELARPYARHCAIGGRQRGADAECLVVDGAALERGLESGAITASRSAAHSRVGASGSYATFKCYMRNLGEVPFCLQVTELGFFNII